jgi:hypothetical protein
MSRHNRVRFEPTSLSIRFAVGTFALLACAALAAHDPDVAHAALRTAAGGGSSGSGGFASLGNFVDHITTYLIWLAVPLCSLGIVGGGIMLLVGHARATQVLTLVAIGFAIVVSSKGLAA